MRHGRLRQARPNLRQSEAVMSGLLESGVV
jgi:hypothetical protein